MLAPAEDGCIFTSSLGAFRRIIAYLNFAFQGNGLFLFLFIFFTFSTVSEEKDTVSTINPKATTPPQWVCSCSCSHAPLLRESFLTDCNAEEHALTSTGVYIKKKSKTKKRTKMRLIRRALSNNNPISTVLHAKLFANEWCQDVCTCVVKSISDHSNYWCDSCEG